MARTRTSEPGKKAMRYAVPTAVVGVVAVSVGLVPALADNGDPELPGISAEELVAKVAASEVDQFSGTVRVSTDLGLPGLQSGAADLLGDAVPSPSQGSGSADPSEKLTELALGEHELEVAADGPEKHRVSMGKGADEYVLVHNGDEVWAHDTAENAVFHATAPEGSEDGDGGSEKNAPKGLEGLTPGEAAEQALDAVGETTAVTVDGTTRIAGRDAYELSLAPKNAPDSTVEAMRIAVDAENGAPLRFTLAAAEGGKPVVEIGFTKIDFGKPTAGTFDFTLPKDAKVTEAEEWDGEKNNGKGAGEDSGKDSRGLPDLGALRGLPGVGALGSGGEPEVRGKGWNSVLTVKGEGASDAGSGPDADRAGGLLDAYSEKAEGDFGTGRVFSTRVVNVLLTDDGEVYAGALTKEGLIKAADAG